ncbi:hypothetical protein GNI_106360 [Gregarina niphandrodes]|uniref:Uncharacterized protein n=1 Tax=Gregarina niphandrodes TaxID=110365 RepID=A0A023B464_GRENI|nr:hypothetical protein GNI_106360 [Gregarina niphandrodes]EZG56005.1 hypothetical protein GNI_106360 [Gregarina niphandrodes]|eukprot:XP_011131373.1 hypothetical protein GNI_106360 [Gregarina niphandrodes]
MGAAKSAVNSILNDLVTVLNSYGAEYDLGGLQVREETDWNTRKRLGVTVEQSMVVKVTKGSQDPARSEDATQKVSTAQEVSALMIEDILSVPSSESIRIQSVGPYLGDAESAKQDALAKATQNCIDRGMVIAKVFNRSLDLGDVRVEMLHDEGFSTFRSTLETSRAPASLGTSDAVTISARVKCTFDS